MNPKIKPTEPYLFTEKCAAKLSHLKELASISDEVEAMYQSLHPDENIGGIQLTLNPKFKKSLELSASFEGHTNIAPQSVYSESHLDTLGLCVFLALAKKYGGKETVLLLDDVVMSVDEQHLGRLIDLLHLLDKEFAHILLTTHYRPWRDRYRNHRAPADKVHFIELRPWTLATGIRLQKGKNLIQELRDTLTGDYFDRQQVAAKAGIMLENILDYLTLTYSSRVRRKPKQDYTLGELLDAVFSKLAKSLKVEHLSKNADGKYDESVGKREIVLLPFFEELKKLAFIRNQIGAHFNLSGSDIPDSEIETFARNTLSLGEALLCPDTGEFPCRANSGAYHETRSKSIRMHPLQEPS